MSEWYSDLEHDAFASKHVRVVFDDGTVMDGRLAYDQSSGYVRMGSSDLTLKRLDGVIYSGGCVVVLVCGEDEQWHLLDGIKSLDLVWDEHDWKQIEDQPLRHGDAVVANGRLYKVSAIMPGEYYPQILTDTPLGQCIPMYLVSCALRRKGAIPAASGYYEDKGGLHWVRAAGDKEDKPWRMVEPYAAMIPAMSCEEMLDRVPLTPVHFESGKAK